MEEARKHIEEIRRNKFLIGQQVSNPLTQDLHNAVINLSAELYTKDVHFLMELIQNAEDNEYSEGVEPGLEFVLTRKDITGLGAHATLLVFNNEVGFSKDNIESICSIGRSTKKGQRQKGFIGEKGIGFKSVFLVSAQPHILSNGYQIRFNEVPDPDCGVGYIVPEWFTEKPSASDIQNIYGCDKILPATTIILPLKPDKLAVVKKHLSEIHPELLLFLHKIKRLSVREKTAISVPDSVSAISIASERNLVPLQTRDADSRIVHLSLQEKSDSPGATCRYFIFRKVFSVDTKYKVQARKNVNEWTISLAFPFGDRLSRGSSSVGIFAFLPTAMVTKLPFIIQADFILSSSREAILLHSAWNLGILHQVPSCFCSAIQACMKFSKMKKNFPILRVLEFLPLDESPVKQLNVIRDSIKPMLVSNCIVPCESLLSEELVLRKSKEVLRDSREFKKIYTSIKDLIAPANNKTSPEMFFLHNSAEDSKYDRIWTFLGLPSEEDSRQKCVKFIQENNIIFRVPGKLYADILFFLSKSWNYHPCPPTLEKMHLLKYDTLYNGEKSCSIGQLQKNTVKVFYVEELQHHSWVGKCSLLMGSPDEKFFLTDSIVTAIKEHEEARAISSWLYYPVGVSEFSMKSYCSQLSRFVEKKKDAKLAASFAQFVYHSTLKFPSILRNVSYILKSMPVVGRGNQGVQMSKEALVPASRSKWVKLFGKKIDEHEKDKVGEVKEENKEGEEDMEREDDWFNKYVILGEVYAEATNFAGESAPEFELLNFLIQHGKAIDLPDMYPPNGPIYVASCELKCDEALLLLEWIRSLRAKEGQWNSCTKYKIPDRFLDSIRCGKWMKTYSGFSSPTSCYLYDGIESSDLLDFGKAFEVVSAIDEEYYESKIRLFKAELMFIGVQFGSHNLYGLIVDQIKAHVSSSEMSAEMGISVLRFIRYLNRNKEPVSELVDALKEGKWLKTSEGYFSPSEVVYLTSGIGKAISQITDLYLVDNAYYGNEFNRFLDELKLLGVKIDLGDVYDLIPDHFKFHGDLSLLSTDAVLLLLKCIRKLGPAANSLKEQISTLPWINTTLGFKCPSESLLLDPSWSCIINVVPFPLIDVTYYGTRIRTYKAELEAVGVAVNLDQACNMLIEKVKMLISSNDLTADAVNFLLDFMKQLNMKNSSELTHLVSFLSSEKWLKTSHGFKSASDCVLSDFKWRTVSIFVDLPFIDEVFYGSRICSFKDELKILGVVVDFCGGAHIIARGLEFPDDQSSIPAESIKSLLHCAQSLRHSTESSDQFLLEQVVSKLRGGKWLKTHMGYRIPEESLIFRSEWKSYLEEQDGPFIDRGFYGTFSSLEINALQAIGVKEDISEVCTSLFQTLPFHEETPAILRVYKFLQKSKWSLDFGCNYSPQLWIPDQIGDSGKWVKKSACLCHDRDNLFGSFLHVLDKHYEDELLSFMSLNFGVDFFPTVYRYIELWDSWVKHNHSLSFLELHSFWQYVSDNWNTFTQNNLEKTITVLPATTISGMVELVVKDEVFIPDNLELKKAFAEVSTDPLFVWFPQNGSSSLTKLYQIYSSFGVRKISKSVEFSVKCKFEEMILEESLIGKPLIKIVLAFLANPIVNMMVEERHRICKHLLDIPVYGTDIPMIVDYSLNLPISKKKLAVQVRKSVLWDKNFKRILIHKPSLSCGEIPKDIEFVSSFAQAISEVVLPNTTDPAGDLCKIIKMGFAFGFQEDNVDSLLVSEDLELSPMDSAFLECLFLATSASPLASRKRKSLRSDSPCTSGKVRRK